MQLRLITTVDVNEGDYAREYGLAADQVRDDALGHVPELLHAALVAQAEQMGCFTVIVTEARVTR